MEAIKKILSFIGRALVYVARVLAAAGKRLATWWMGAFRAREGRSKAIFAGVSAVVACIALLIPVALLTPTPTPTPEAVAVEGEGEATEGVPTNTPGLTSTAAPTETEEPTQTATPSATPQPTETSAPTVTASADVPAGELTQVVNVVDGDTIDVLVDGEEYRVRYIGMDTPERGDLFFDEATAANRDLVEGQTVIMVKDVSETDRYGRLLRYIYLLDGTFVNAELVRQGFAQIATFPPDVAHQDDYLALQQEARDAGRGLWGQIAQVPTNTPAPPPPPPATTAAPIAPSATPVPQVTNTPAPQPTEPPPPPPTDTPAPAPTEPPPPAPADVVISYIYYDGEVPQVESDEYAVITNQGGSPANLAGWHLNAGAPGQDFYFPGFELQPGQQCRVYTNEDHPESCGFNFHHGGQALWNNGGDCGYLYDASGAEVSRYCY